ncbi:MAG: hypothetical protein HYS13_26180 [Planctomycetia bacterium]|nr:hypothetical protein [Planctomycetia bacterium]
MEWKDPVPDPRPKIAEPQDPRYLEIRARPRGFRWKLCVPVAVVLLLGGAAGGAWMWYSAQQAKGVALVERLGGKVRWTNDRRGEGDVVSVLLSGGNFTDQRLVELSPWWITFPGLKDLDLSGSGVTDAGLVYLRGSGLSNLILHDTRVTDAGLMYLAGLPNLYSLSLQQTSVGDGGLLALKSLPGLTTLYLSGTKVSDAGLDVLAAMPKLTYVQLDAVSISGAAVRKLEAARPDLHISR